MAGPSLAWPLLLRPHYVPKPWGGRRMVEILGREDVPDGPIGESWDVVDLDDVQSVVEGGPFDGRTLREVWGAPYPLLLKVLDAQDALSVQLHPDGADGHPVKEEAWIALADGGSVAVGTFHERALPAAGAWIEALDNLTLQGPGSSAPTMVHITPGTVHAILGGSLLFEVQNPADITWRLDDHGRVGLDGRPRALHLEEAQALLARAPVPCVSERISACELRGQRFFVRMHPPGTTALPACTTARAAFVLDGGTVAVDSEELDVPRARSVVLSTVACVVESAGWIVEAGEPVATRP